MAIDISAQTRRVVYTGSAGTGPYAFAFNILVNTDIAVYYNTTELTLTTDYNVAIGAAGTGNITLVVNSGGNIPSTPSSSDRVTLVGDRTLQRTTDFTTGGPLFATTLNDELDSLTIFTQQNLEQSNRSLRAPNTDPTTVNMELPLNTTRANKYLTFDVSGNPVAQNAVGTYRGNWAASTTYVLQDIVKDTSTSNIFIAITAHTSSGSQPLTTNTDAAKWSLVVDAASAGSSATAAASSATASATSATLSGNYANKTDGAVTGSDYASKAWAIGGTGITNTSGKGSAKDWAIDVSGTVDSSEYSSKEYAAGTQASTGGSAKSWAQDADAVNGAGTNDRSAKNWAQGASMTGSTLGGSSKDWAQLTSGTVDGTNYSAKYHAAAAAISASAASTSKGNAATSASASAASAAAAAATKDSIDEFYLGAQSSNPTVDNNGDAVTAGDWYFNTSSNETRIYNGSAWQVTAVSTSGLLTAANNLSDLANAGTARSNLGLGTAATTAATAYVGKTAATGSASIPVGTTVQRDGSPAEGMFRYNSTTDEFEGYAASGWGSIGGGASAGGAIYENSNAIAANYTLTSSTNGMSVGPITIASGVTVTVPSGANWVVL